MKRRTATRNVADFVRVATDACNALGVPVPDMDLGFNGMLFGAKATWPCGHVVYEMDRSELRAMEKAIETMISQCEAGKGPRSIDHPILANNR